MKHTPIWLKKIIAVPFALVILVLALSGYPVLTIRDAGAAGDLTLSASKDTWSETIFYVT